MRPPSIIPVRLSPSLFADHGFVHARCLSSEALNIIDGIKASYIASGMPRNVPDPSNRGRTAEPGYGSLAHDRALWRRHANRQSKGHTFPQTQRWPRAPGPGSNMPAVKAMPGPGAYGKLHEWPQNGFRGGALGYNHNRSVG